MSTHPPPPVAREGRVGAVKQSAQPDARPVLRRVKAAGAIEGPPHPVVEGEQLVIGPFPHRRANLHRQPPGRRIDGRDRVELPLRDRQLRRLRGPRLAGAAKSPPPTPPPTPPPPPSPP